MDKKLESYLILPWRLHLLSLEIILLSYVDLKPIMVNPKLPSISLNLLPSIASGMDFGD